GAVPFPSEAHHVAPIPVHRADRGLGDERLGAAFLAAAELEEARLLLGRLADAVLHELHRLVVLEPEEAGRTHEIALAQAVARHGLVVALVAEHGPDHGELAWPARHDLARAQRVELALHDEVGPDREHGHGPGR